MSSLEDAMTWQLELVGRRGDGMQKGACKMIVGWCKRRLACNLVRFVDEIYLAYETMATKLKPSG
jgi:hypothetical protein